MKDKIEKIKVGELLYVVIEGEITGVDTINKTVGITFKYTLPDNTGTVSNTVRFPIEYGTLAEMFYPFMVPGPFATGSDFYEVVGNERHVKDNENITYIVKHENRTYKLVRDKTFSRTGKYYLVPMGASGNVIVKYAQMLGEEHLEKIKHNIVGTIIRKGTIQGRFLFFIDKKTDNPDHIVFTNYEGIGSSNASDVVVKLQDSESFLEISVPLHLFFSQK